MTSDASRRRFPLQDRVIEVIDETLTGEVLLDEALKMMKSSERMSVASWIDLMSGKIYFTLALRKYGLMIFVGETWNLMKIGYQLKQVRERLAKGLVDKGILRTEKRNFLLFDMATHPVADGNAKDEIRRRVRNVLTARTVVLPASQFLPEEMEFRYLRTIAMVCAAYAANVLENALSTLGHEARERAFAQVDELLAEYSQWPFARRTGGSGGIGANLGQVIGDEVTGATNKELQLEVCHIQVSFGWLKLISTGCRRMFERFHPPRLPIIILTISSLRIPTSHHQLGEKCSRFLRPGPSNICTAAKSLRSGPTFRRHTPYFTNFFCLS